MLLHISPETEVPGKQLHGLDRLAGQEPLDGLLADRLGGVQQAAGVGEEAAGQLLTIHRAELDLLKGVDGRFENRLEMLGGDRFAVAADVDERPASSIQALLDIFEETAHGQIRIGLQAGHAPGRSALCAAPAGQRPVVKE